MEIKKAGVLAIGTEVTDGQIVNTHAPWISAQAAGLGFAVNWHLAVPDNEALILKALNLAKDEVDYLFITGGLGPTLDDKTRQMLAQFAGSPLELNPQVWEKIKAILQSRGITPRPMQEKQAQFPKGSLVVPNPVGTAPGFILRVGALVCLALPGPPKELQAMWQESISPFLEAENSKASGAWVLKSWYTLGLGESEIAEKVEAILGPEFLSDPHRQGALGYRLFKPYVEVKLKYLKSEAAFFAPLVEKLNPILKPYGLFTEPEDIPIRQLVLRLNTWLKVSPSKRRVVFYLDDFKAEFLPKLLGEKISFWSSLSFVSVPEPAKITRHLGGIVKTSFDSELVANSLDAQKNFAATLAEELKTAWAPGFAQEGDDILHLVFLKLHAKQDQLDRKEVQLSTKEDQLGTKEVQLGIKEDQFLSFSLAKHHSSIKILAGQELNIKKSYRAAHVAFEHNLVHWQNFMQKL